MCQATLHQGTSASQATFSFFFSFFFYIFSTASSFHDPAITLLHVRKFSSMQRVTLTEYSQCLSVCLEWWQKYLKAVGLFDYNSNLLAVGLDTHLSLALQVTKTIKKKKKRFPIRASEHQCISRIGSSRRIEEHIKEALETQRRSK